MRKRVLHLFAICFFTSTGSNASAQEALVRPGDPLHPDSSWGGVWRARKGSEVTHCVAPAGDLNVRFEKPLSVTDLGSVNQAVASICRELNHCEETVPYEKHILALDKFVNKLLAENEEKISKARKPPELTLLYDKSKRLTYPRYRLRMLAWRLGYLNSPLILSSDYKSEPIKIQNSETAGFSAELSQAPVLKARSKITNDAATWKVEQRFSGFVFQGFGGAKSSAIINLAPNKFHLAWKNSKAQMLVMAPDWKVRTWNDWHSDATTFSNFRETVQGKSTDHFMYGQRFERGLAGAIAGIPATEYHSVPDVENSSNGGTKSDTAEDLASVSVWLANDIEISPHLSKLFSMIYAAPDLKRLPLSVRVTDNTGKTIRYIETVSAKRVKLPASAFKLPPYRSPGKVYQPSLFLDKPL